MIARVSIPNNLSRSAQTMIQPMTGVAGLQSVGSAGFQTSIANSLGSMSSGSSAQVTVIKDVCTSTNSSIETSVWQRPPELCNRPDVDLLVAIPPDSSEQSHEPAENGKEGSGADDDGEEPATKKTRQDKNADYLEKEGNAKEEPEPVEEKPIDSAAQAELQAQQERNKIPLEVRLRNSAFEAFTKERIEIERAERRKRSKEAKVEYKNLLVEADLHGKSSFTSFTKKYGKDPRFEALKKSEIVKNISRLHQGTLGSPWESCIEEDNLEEEQQMKYGQKTDSLEEQKVPRQGRQNENSVKDGCRSRMNERL
uniref:FF domain-containing protein n=1 Tax=Ditylenchus dipsaci TaxID=166011 RepID=A0A915DC53_9BILA